MATLLSCEICGQQDEMFTEADVRTHMLLVHEEQGPTCPLCDLSELTLEELQLHINTAHVELLSPAGKKASHNDHQGTTSTMKPNITNNTLGGVSCTMPHSDVVSYNGTEINAETKLSRTASAPHLNEQQMLPAANAISMCNRSSSQKSKLKTAAGFPTSYSPEQNGIPSRGPTISRSSQGDYPESSQRDYPDTDYPPQPDDHPLNPNTSKTRSNNCDNNHLNTSLADDSLEMDTFGLNGSMLLVSDSDDDCASEPSNNLDSPSRKRPRNATNSSRSSDCSSLSAYDQVIKDKGPPKSPLKRFLEAITPKNKAGEKSALNINSPSGIWFDTDDSIHDTLPGQSSTENMCNEDDKPECPFCNLEGLDEKSMTQHIEVAHSNLLSPAPTLHRDNNRKKTSESKPTLLSLSQKATKLESAILCPICGLGSYDPDFLTVHINTEHSEMGEGSKQAGANTLNSSSINGSKQLTGDEAGPSTSNSSGCPVCGLRGLNPTDLARHVEEHFEDTPQKRGGACSEDDKLARQLADQEKQLRERKEREEFKRLQAQYGMDGAAGFQAQSESALEKAVARGQMSISDYHQQRGRIKQIVATGIDDGQSRTQDLTDSIEAFYSRTNNRNVSHGRVCSSMDHYGGTQGDRGWGCGYRNLQMLLSGMIRDPMYRDVVFNGRNSMPSIGKLQHLIETAWDNGWDPQGREQLGGTVKNTKKWIGATEVVALLSCLKTKCVLVDFHKPTGPNGTHSRLFEWVRDYFGQPGARLFNRLGNQVRTNKMPLYLQHQGHSRTIIGYEILKDDSIRLLIFDPSMSQGHRQSLQAKELTAETMRPIRKSVAQMKAKQYQIVGVQGVFTNDREHQIIESLFLMLSPNVSQPSHPTRAFSKMPPPHMNKL